MSHSSPTTNLEPPSTPEDRTVALFANLVLQQSNLALLYLGKVPGPEGQAPVRDLDAASLFIDTLEMLEAKTRGNLSPHEQNLLQQSLTNLRMHFVEAVEAGEPSPAPAAQPPPSPPPATDGAKSPGEPGATAPPGGDDSRKKFVKKY